MLQNNIMDCHKLIESTMLLYTKQFQDNKTFTESLMESLHKLKGMHIHKF